MKSLEQSRFHIAGLEMVEEIFVIEVECLRCVLGRCLSYCLSFLSLTSFTYPLEFLVMIMIRMGLPVLVAKCGRFGSHSAFQSARGTSFEYDLYGENHLAAINEVAKGLAYTDSSWLSCLPLVGYTWT